MKKAFAIVAPVVAGGLATLKFMAENPVAETQANLKGYVASPLIGSALATLYAIAVHPITFAISFFLFGCVVGGWFSRRKTRASKMSDLEFLGIEVSNAAYAIDNMSGFQTNSVVFSRLNVVLDKMRAAGFVLPPNNGTFYKDRMAHYLHQVAEYLKDGQAVRAKAVAAQMVKEWPSGQIPGVEMTPL